jgi:hypothetical protein
MMLPIIPCLLGFAYFAGPGVVMVVGGANGLAFRFAEGDLPGMKLGPIDAFEVENGARGRRLCRLRARSRLVEWGCGDSRQPWIH